MHWDLFCRVIDNHGDLGVCWRLACDLSDRGQTVQLWVDDASALSWMAPHGHSGVSVSPWADCVGSEREPDVLVEAFGCEPDASYLARRVAAAGSGRQPAWINLEYLSAEAYVERQHRLASPVFHGAAAGWTRHFFYPGFTPRTGGLIRERWWSSVDSSRNTAKSGPGAFMRLSKEVTRSGPWVSLFCYEPPGLKQALSHSPQGAHWWVTPGRAHAAFHAALGRPPGQSPAVRPKSSAPPHTCLPYLPQAEFDSLLTACDFNAVRGEDSLVRALLAGKPFVWNIYPQDDGAHGAKLDAFLHWLDAPASLAKFHRVWNGIEPGTLPQIEWQADRDWAASVRAARERLLSQTDLGTQLIEFAHALRADSR